MATLNNSPRVWKDRLHLVSKDHESTRPELGFGKRRNQDPLGASGRRTAGLAAGTRRA